MSQDTIAKQQYFRRRQTTTAGFVESRRVPGGAGSGILICWMALSGERPLERWKEIADYLGRSERTVQRWERKGLPIHRHDVLGVIAYRSELDAWVETVESGSDTSQRRSDPNLDPDSPTTPPPVSGVFAPQVGTGSGDQDTHSAGNGAPHPASLRAWSLRFAQVGSGIIFVSALLLAVLESAYGLAILAFGLGAVFVALSYMHVRDTPAARAVVAIYLLAGMCYIGSASTMPEFQAYVINAGVLPPSPAYLMVMGLKFVPLFFLVFFYWVLLGCYEDVGLARKPLWHRAYVLLGLLLLLVDLLLVGAALGDDRIVRAGVPGYRALLVGSLVVLVGNLSVWLAARNYFRQEKISSYRPLFSVCAVAYLIVSVAAYFVDHEHNLFNRYYLDVRWPEPYVSRNPAAIADLGSLGAKTKAEIGPDLANLVKDREFNEVLRSGTFYKQHSDEAFQVFTRSVMFAYRRPAAPNSGPAPFITVRFPRELADALRFEPIGNVPPE